MFLSTACVLACILSHNCHRLISVSCKPVLLAIIIIIIINCEFFGGQGEDVLSSREASYIVLVLLFTEMLFEAHVDQNYFQLEKISVRYWLP